MVIGITGNTNKEQLWEPVARFVTRLRNSGHEYVLHSDLESGLRERGLLGGDLPAADQLAESCDILLSVGGDGTLLNTAFEVGDRGTPILGVNIGRLGFLASLESAQLGEALDILDAGDYVIDHRMVLEASLTDGAPLLACWALNEFVIHRSREAGLIAVEVSVDGIELNSYWADGLLIATPTGSTAYNLAAGGPILVPGSGAIVVTAMAPHTLTVRPVVIPDSAVIDVKVLEDHAPYIFTADGRSVVIGDDGHHIQIRRAAHTVNLVRLPGQNFFTTLRTKLMWGARKS